MNDKLFFDIANIAESNGYSLSIAGIIIVFITLLIISLFVGLLPVALSFFDKFSKKEKLAGDDEIALAISVVLHNQNK